MVSIWSPCISSSITKYIQVFMPVPGLLAYIMMTSSNGNTFRVTGPLCGEFTGPGEFPAQRPVRRSFDVCFDLRLNKRLSKQSWGWWFETQSRPLWRQCNVYSTTCTGRFNWTDVTERVIHFINSKTYPVTLLCLIGIINSFWLHITSISIRIKFQQTRDQWQLGGLSIIQQFTRATVLQLRLFEHRRDCFRSICKRFIPKRVQQCWWHTM